MKTTTQWNMPGTHQCAHFAAHLEIWACPNSSQDRQQAQWPAPHMLHNTLLETTYLAFMLAIKLHEDEFCRKFVRLL
jgi:hypothetical protein